MKWFSRQRGAIAIERFENFDIELFAYQRSGAIERVKVRVLDSPYQGEGLDEYDSIEIPGRLRERAKQLETRDLDLAGIKSLGVDLAAVLLPEKALNLYGKSLASLQPAVGLRIRLRLGDWALATLPWEYAYVPPDGASGDEQVNLGFWSLNRRLSLVRFEIAPGLKQSLDPVDDGQLRLLALTAEPHGSADLALEKEIGLIEKAMSKIDAIRLELMQHASWDKFQGALNKAVHIVHFAGHGRFNVEMGADYGTIEGEGALLFETDSAGEDAKSAEDVAVNLNGTGVRLVVLSACEGGRVDGVRAWSGIATALSRSGVPAVLAMQFRVRDDKAVSFSQHFYENLAAGGSIDTATTAGRLAMFDSADDYGRDWGAPVLYLKAKESRLLPRTEREPWLTRRFAVNATLGLGLFVLGAIYWLLHLQPWLSGLYLAGGASLVAFLSLLAFAIDKLFDTAIMGALRRWFQKRSATPWLGVACAALLFLAYATSSIFLIPAANSDARFDVRVLSDNKTLEQNWTVGSDTKGKTHFFKVWRPTNVTLSAGEGSGYLDFKTRLYPGFSVHHEVPGDFEEKRVTLLRLVPTQSFWSKFEAGNHVILRITVGQNPPVDIADPRRRVLVIGDRKIEMDRKLLEEKVQLEERLSRFLADGDMPSEHHGPWMEAWDNVSLEPEVTLRPIDPVVIELIENDVTIFRKSVSPADKVKNVRDVFMEAQ